SINSSSLNLDEVFRIALRGVDRIARNDGASITLLGERTGEAVKTISSEASSANVAQEEGPIAAEEARALLGGADTFLSQDTRLSTEPLLLSYIDRDILSVLIVSIRLGERRLGLLQVVS